MIRADTLEDAVTCDLIRRGYRPLKGEGTLQHVARGIAEAMPERLEAGQVRGHVTAILKARRKSYAEARRYLS